MNIIDKTIEELKSNFPRYLLITISATLGFLIKDLANQINVPLIWQALDGISSKSWLPIVGICLVLLIIETAWLINLKSKPKNKLRAKFGVLWDGNENAFCPTCKANLSYTPNMNHTEFKFRCNKCKATLFLVNENGANITAIEAKKLL